MNTLVEHMLTFKFMTATQSNVVLCLTTVEYTLLPLQDSLRDMLLSAVYTNKCC